MDPVLDVGRCAGRDNVSLALFNPPLFSCALATRPVFEVTMLPCFFTTAPEDAAGKTGLDTLLESARALRLAAPPLRAPLEAIVRGLPAALFRCCAFPFAPGTRFSLPKLGACLTGRKGY